MPHRAPVVDAGFIPSRTRVGFLFTPAQSDRRPAFNEGVTQFTQALGGPAQALRVTDGHDALGRAEPRLGFGVGEEPPDNVLRAAYGAAIVVDVKGRFVCHNNSLAMCLL